jgi:inhibitor of KinA
MRDKGNSWSFPYELIALGDCAVIIRLGNEIDVETNQIVRHVSEYLEDRPFVGFIECVPSFAAVAVHYDPLLVRKSRNAAELQHTTIFETVCTRLKAYLSNERLTEADLPTRTIEIPVCYGGEHGPDLSFVAEHNGLSENEVISIHSAGSYLVHMLGFAPGFPYMGGMSEKIAAPRHRTPRTSTPQGSVGIAGNQTGVYSIATPGGWQLIGRTPLALFRPQDDIPSLLRPGDRVRFIPITSQQYMQYLEGER